jgi:hypothetical protein
LAFDAEGRDFGGVGVFRECWVVVVGKDPAIEKGVTGF